MSSYFDVAQICLNGHVINSRHNDRKEIRSNHCRICGESTTIECLECNSKIRGGYVSGWHFGTLDNSPNYCHDCGQPYPWTVKILNSAVELVALDDELSPEHKVIIEHTFPYLLVDAPDTPLEVAKYKKHIANSQKFVKDGLRNLFIDVVSESVKKSIWE